MLKPWPWNSIKFISFISAVCVYHSLSPLIHLFQATGITRLMQSPTCSCCPLHVVACSFSVRAVAWDVLSLWFCICRMCRLSAVVCAVRLTNLPPFITGKWWTKTLNRRIFQLFFPFFSRGKNWLLHRRREMLTYSVENGPDCWMLIFFSFSFFFLHFNMTFANRGNTCYWSADSLKSMGSFDCCEWWLDEG